MSGSGAHRRSVCRAVRAMDSWISNLARPPAKDIEDWNSELERNLAILDVRARDAICDLELAVWNFLRNRSLAERSKRAGHLKNELADLAKLSGNAVALRFGRLDSFELDPFFGIMPGASIELSIDNKAHLRLLPDDDALLAASVKTQVRHGDNGIAPTGLLYLRRSTGIAGRILKNASMDELARFLMGLAGIGAEPDIPMHRREQLLLLVGRHLLVAGSLGSSMLFRALDDELATATFDEKLALLDDIVLLCLQDVEDMTGSAHALASVIFAKVADWALPAERKRILLLYSQLFSREFADFASVLSKRVDTQYRLEESVRSGRRDARRWHEAHAGWLLIDEVLRPKRWPPRSPWPMAMRGPGLSHVSTASTP